MPDIEITADDLHLGYTLITATVATVATVTLPAGWTETPGILGQDCITVTQVAYDPTRWTVTRTLAEHVPTGATVVHTEVGEALTVLPTDLYALAVGEHLLAVHRVRSEQVPDQSPSGVLTFHGREHQVHGDWIGHTAHDDIQRRHRELRVIRASKTIPSLRIDLDTGLPQIDPSGYECTCEAVSDVIDGVPTDELERPLREDEVDTSDCIVHNADANAREAERVADTLDLAISSPTV